MNLNIFNVGQCKTKCRSIWALGITASQPFQQNGGSFSSTLSLRPCTFSCVVDSPPSPRQKKKINSQCLFRWIGPLSTSFDLIIVSPCPSPDFDQIIPCCKDRPKDRLVSFLHKSNQCLLHHSLCYKDETRHMHRRSKHEIRKEVNFSSNNKEDLCALWLLLKLAADKEISSMQVPGDRKLLIDWAKDRA